MLLQSCATDPRIVAEQQKAKIAKQSLKETPKWFKKLPKKKKVLYAKGTAVSGDMQLSIDKAKIAAKRSLAEKLESTISSKTKQFAKETGIDEMTEVYTELEQVTINSVKEASIVGFNEYKSKKIEEIEENDRQADFNKILQIMQKVLKPIDREIISLVYLGYKYDEIAKKLKYKEI